MDSVIPAELAFLTIYSPALGSTDESVSDQILYFYSSKAHKARIAQRCSSGSATSQEDEERNEQLRQVGLAQGMVAFAR